MRDWVAQHDHVLTKLKRYLEPLLQRADGPGRPTELDLRTIIDALLYKNRTSCQWRMLPSNFPPHSSVRYYFDKWRQDGTWERINDHLR
jgi:transposase